MESYFTHRVHLAAGTVLESFGNFPDEYASLSFAEYADKIFSRVKVERERRKGPQPFKPDPNKDIYTIAKEEGDKSHARFKKEMGHIRFANKMGWLIALGFFDLSRDMPLGDAMVVLQSAKNRSYSLNDTDYDNLGSNADWEINDFVKSLRILYAAIPEESQAKNLVYAKVAMADLDLREANLTNEASAIKQEARTTELSPERRAELKGMFPDIKARRDVIVAERDGIINMYLFACKIDEMVDLCLIDFPKNAPLSEIMGLVEDTFGQS